MFIFVIDFLCGSRSGSVIVDLTLVYVNQTVVPNGSVAVETLTEAIDTGTTNLAVDNSTITLSRLNTRLNKYYKTQ